MIHVVPIICLIIFVIFVEYRLKKHLDDIDKKVKELEEEYETLRDEFVKHIIDKKINEFEDSSNS